MKLSSIGSKPVILGTLGLLGGTMYWSSTGDTATSSALVSRNERELFSEEGSGYYEASGEGGVENINPG